MQRTLRWLGHVARRGHLNDAMNDPAVIKLFHSFLPAECRSDLFTHEYTQNRELWETLCSALTLGRVDWAGEAGAGGAAEGGKPSPEASPLALA